MSLEEHFAAPGPHASAMLEWPDPEPSVLWWPVGAASAPMVVWGNGTAATPAKYRGLLTHLASWGFVVVAANCRRTGTGTEMLASLDSLAAAAAAAVPGSDLSSIALGRVAIAGHSQGAGGTVNAAVKSGTVAAAIPVCLPNERWVSKGDEYDVSALSCPTLFLGGSRDRIVAGPKTLRGFFERTPAPAAMAVLRGAGHNVIQGSGGGYLGFVTAWLRWHVAGDAEAAAAFSGSDPEFLRARAWTSAALKLGPVPD